MPSLSLDFPPLLPPTLLPCALLPSPIVTLARGAEQSPILLLADVGKKLTSWADKAARSQTDRALAPLIDKHRQALAVHFDAHEKCQNLGLTPENHYRYLIINDGQGKAYRSLIAAANAVETAAKSLITQALLLARSHDTRGFAHVLDTRAESQDNRSLADLAREYDRASGGRVRRSQVSDATGLWDGITTVQIAQEIPGLDRDIVMSERARDIDEETGEIIYTQGTQRGISWLAWALATRAHATGQTASVEHEARAQAILAFLAATPAPVVRPTVERDISHRQETVAARKAASRQRGQDLEAIKLRAARASLLDVGQNPTYLRISSAARVVDENLTTKGLSKNAKRKAQRYGADSRLVYCLNNLAPVKR